MCLLVPGRITKIEGDSATLDYGSETRVARLIEDGYSVGDYVLVQGGVVIDKVDANEAKAALESYAQATRPSERA